VEEEVGKILNPVRQTGVEIMPRYEGEVEFGGQTLGRHSERRGAAWAVLRGLLQSAKKSSEMNALVNLLTYLCPYGNTEEDILAIKQIQNDIQSTHNTVLNNCVDIIGKNVVGRTKLSPVVKAWLIKR